MTINRLVIIYSPWYLGCLCKKTCLPRRRWQCWSFVEDKIQQTIIIKEDLADDMTPRRVKQAIDRRIKRETRKCLSEGEIHEYETMDRRNVLALDIVIIVVVVYDWRMTSAMEMPTMVRLLFLRRTYQAYRCGHIFLILVHNRSRRTHHSV